MKYSVYPISIHCYNLPQINIYRNIAEQCKDPEK